jgi:hypothetical protein
MSALSAKTPSVSGRRQAPGLTADFADLVRTFKTLIDPYQPELHYMRGPGPKWHAKHGRAQPAVAWRAFELVRVKAR